MEFINLQIWNHPSLKYQIANITTNLKIHSSNLSVANRFADQQNSFSDTRWCDDQHIFLSNTSIDFFFFGFW